MRLHRADARGLLPAAYGIPWVPEIPRQWRQGTEPGVTAVTNIFGNSDGPAPDNDAAGRQRRQTRPPTPRNSDGPAPDNNAAGRQPRETRPPTPGNPDGPAPDNDAAGRQPRETRPPTPGNPD